ncbi:MAG: type III pantothenate kinase [Acidobacteria bacterium]|nr:type III pantothenate kinase [Acidobacteriota bacterium]
MLLAIDIGNSSTKFGAFDGETLVRRHTIPTLRGRTADEIRASIDEEFDGRFSAIVVSSVVPELDAAFRALGENHFNQTPVFVDNRSDFGLVIRYSPPENLGVDRLVAAFAAREKYGAPVIVGDFGTATTIDAVSAAGEYLGGVITPGPNTLSEALHIKTSKLPRVELRRPESVIGRTTVGSIQAGVFYGYVGLTEGILRRMLDELGEPARIVATGGFAGLIAADCPLIETVDENLMLDGLRRLYERNQSKNPAAVTER